MATFMLGSKEFDTDNLTEDQKAHFQAIQVCEAKILEMNAQVSIFQTARNSYGEKLLKMLEESAENSGLESDGIPL
ncbi:hypothetical protein THMIRHAS_13360 [Thiosulfatimonas sediminis]|uniref:Uncharacterized protein n=1 Tax=Thiosulfatimonas sediminis TaxID=2675054 RepID=A0A6F8PV00_9GAMM|nr:DUF6447 family protein [Thiosulfatimonas sediminis]BBP45963.1 hypothetical protein THMIRHAS_13360 [Thiosulfatimonas sediminis]